MPVQAPTRGQPFYTIIPRNHRLQSPYTTHWGYGGHILDLTLRVPWLKRGNGGFYDAAHDCRWVGFVPSTKMIETFSWKGCLSSVHRSEISFLRSYKGIPRNFHKPSKCYQAIRLDRYISYLHSLTYPLLQLNNVLYSNFSSSEYLESSIRRPAYYDGRQWWGNGQALHGQ